MSKKIITCIVCPAGCKISVKGTDKEIDSVEGYMCKRGLEYAKNEFLDPVRNLTATVKAIDYKSPVISVRTSKPIPKDMQMECMEVIKKLVAVPPYKIGKVVCENILGTGADIILTNE